MKILYIVPNVTGLKRFFSTGELIDEGMPAMFKPLAYLIENGHSISIFVYPYYNNFTNKIPITKSYIKINFLDLPNENILLKILRKCSLSIINLHPMFEVISLVRQILKLKKKINCKIVYGHDFIGVLTGYLISRYLSVPFISRLYGASFMRRANGKLSFYSKIKYWEKYLPLKIKSDCLLITNDGSISSQELKQIKPYTKNYKLWFNGYDCSPVRRNNSTKNKIFTLISISILSNWKNVDSVIDVFNIILKNNCDAHLLIIGDGAEETALKRRVKEYNIDDKVTFTGRIQQKEVYVYLNNSDVFINLYDRQNLTNTLWEAMSMGKCVITRSEYDNNRAIIKHGENGYLFPINEKEKIADCILKLYNDRALLDKIGSKGKETVEKILPTWDQRVQREYQLIKNIYERSYS